MFLLIPVVVILVVLAFAGVVGLLRLVEERHDRGAGVLQGVGPLGIALGVGAVVLIVLLGLVGVGRDGGGPSPRDRTVTPITAARSAANPKTTSSNAPSGSTVRLSARSDDDAFPRSYRVADGLDPGVVLRVRVAGFGPHATGRVQQCVHARAVECGNAFPVQFGADGETFFQYQVRDDFHVNVAVSGGCRASAARCTLVVEDTEHTTRAEIDTIFYDEHSEAGTIRVDPSSRVVDGQKLTVEVFGYPPGVQVDAMLCAAPAATGSERCGAPGPSVPLVVGPDGTGVTTLVVDDGPVGSQRILCGREVVCGISVVSDAVFVRAPVVTISFAGPAGAGYDPNRLALGLGIAAILIGIAAWFIRRTDWAPVGEAAAPEIDAAEYADLDAIVAALPPEDETLAHHP